MSNHQQVMQNFNKVKYMKLAICLAIDIIGKITFFIPGANVVWAPISGLLIFATFGRLKGLVGGFIGFTEELLPATDFTPTATAMWVYVFIIKKEKTLETYLRDVLKEDSLISKFLEEQKKIS